MAICRAVQTVRHARRRTTHLPSDVPTSAPTATFAEQPTLSGELVVLRPFEESDRLGLAIVDRATGVCVGEAVLNEWEPENARPATSEY